MVVRNGMLSCAVEPADSRNEPIKGIEQNLLGYKSGIRQSGVWNLFAVFGVLNLLVCTER